MVRGICYQWKRLELDGVHGDSLIRDLKRVAPHQTFHNWYRGTVPQRLASLEALRHDGATGVAAYAFLRHARGIQENGAGNPVLLHAMRVWSDRLIGQQPDLATARRAFRRCLVNGHPDKFNALPGLTRGQRYYAGRLFEYLEAVRGLVDSDQIGPLLYPSVLDGAHAAGWRWWVQAFALSALVAVFIVTAVAIGGPMLGVAIGLA